MQNNVWMKIHKEDAKQSIVMAPFVYIILCNCVYVDYLFTVVSDHLNWVYSIVEESQNTY